LLRQGVPHQLVRQHAFFDRREVRDALAYLRLLQQPGDELSLERCLAVPPRQVGAKSLQALKDWGAPDGGSGKRSNATLWDACQAVARAQEQLEKGGTTAPPAAGGACEAAPPPPPALRRQAACAVRAFCEVISELRGEVAALEARAARRNTTAAALFSVEHAGRALVPDLLARVLKQSGYERWLKDEQADGFERWRNVRELANLAAAAEGGDASLVDFLDRVALIQDQDMLVREQTESGQDSARHEKTSRSPPGGPDGKGGEVKLMTIHASKGLEFDVVFVLGVEEDLLPHFHATNARAQEASQSQETGQEGGEGGTQGPALPLPPLAALGAQSDETDELVGLLEQGGLHHGRDEAELIDEERRLLFVAMTRARTRLFLCHAGERLTWGSRRGAKPSRFLRDIPGELRRDIEVAPPRHWRDGGAGRGQDRGRARREGWRLPD